MRFSVSTVMGRLGRGVGVLALAALAACGGGGAGGGDGGGGGGGGDPTGVWTAQMFSNTWGPYQVDLVLQSNGAFSHQWIYFAGSVITNTGTWRTLPDQSILRLDALSAQPASALIGETSVYSVNGNTLVTDLVNCDPASGECRVIYTRVGP
jgi:hypothetical protein